MDSAIIEREALQLPDSRRAYLADRLVESVSTAPLELRIAWVQEADSRMTAFQAGEIPVIDGPSAMAELRAKFAR